MLKSAVYPTRRVDMGRLGELELEVDGVMHKVHVWCDSPPVYRFTVDGSTELTSVGHPIDAPQGAGDTPSAAVIAIRIGTDKPVQMTWSRWHREGATITNHRRNRKRSF